MLKDRVSGQIGTKQRVYFHAQGQSRGHLV